MSRPASRLLARDVVIVLAIKITLIVLAGFFLFGENHRIHVTAETIAHQLLN